MSQPRTASYWLSSIQTAIDAIGQGEGCLCATQEGLFWSPMDGSAVMFTVFLQVQPGLFAFPHVDARRLFDTIVFNCDLTNGKSKVNGYGECWIRDIIR